MPEPIIQKVTEYIQDPAQKAQIEKLIAENAKLQVQFETVKAKMDLEVAELKKKVMKEEIHYKKVTTTQIIIQSLNQSNFTTTMLENIGRSVLQ